MSEEAKKNGRPDENDPIDMIIKAVTPESLGWVRVPDRPRVWERPDGTLHIFSEHQSEMLEVIKPPPV